MHDFRPLVLQRPPKRVTKVVTKMHDFHPFGLHRPLSVQCFRIPSLKQIVHFSGVPMSPNVAPDAGSSMVPHVNQPHIESGTDEGFETAICARIRPASGIDGAPAPAICARIWLVLLCQLLRCHHCRRRRLPRSRIRAGRASR